MNDLKSSVADGETFGCKLWYSGPIAPKNESGDSKLIPKVVSDDRDTMQHTGVSVFMSPFRLHLFDMYRSFECLSFYFSANLNIDCCTASIAPTEKNCAFFKDRLCFTSEQLKLALLSMIALPTVNWMM